MGEMPTLGRSRRRMAPGSVFLLILLGCAALALVWLLRPKKAPLPPATADAGPVVDAAPMAPRAPPKPPPAEDPIKKSGFQRANVTITSSLEAALVAAVGREIGQPLTQVAVRALVWWVDVPGGLRKGDTLEALWQDRTGEEPLLMAVRFKSGKQAQTFRAYRFKPAADKVAGLYQPPGEELELRLVHGPIEDYEQVTSLIRDGRGHKGVDFKTPVGTPVKAPFDGEITRKNWGFRYNGNALELKESGGQGRTATFLHLSEILPEAKLGARVSRGDVLAKSGNTGHSFAPHLHYQLSTNAKPVLDPFASHQSERRSLPETDRASFAAEARRFDALLDGAPVPVPATLPPSDGGAGDAGR